MKLDALIVDANLLTLYVVGTASPSFIARHKRLAAYTVEDYETLLRIIALANVVLLTPNVLTETSNLSRHIAEPARGEVASVLKSVVDASSETYVPSKAAVTHAAFFRLGLTDAAIIRSQGAQTTLLTADLDLHLATLAEGLRSINFNHLRDDYL